MTPKGKAENRYHPPAAPQYFSGEVGPFQSPPVRYRPWKVSFYSFPANLTGGNLISRVLPPLPTPALQPESPPPPTSRRSRVFPPFFTTWIPYPPGFSGRAVVVVSLPPFHPPFTQLRKSTFRPPPKRRKERLQISAHLLPSSQLHFSRCWVCGGGWLSYKWRPFPHSPESICILIFRRRRQRDFFINESIRDGIVQSIHLFTAGF